ncbi:hypothetical protein NFI96_012967, partial [Prochilodus magdalenae]
IHSPYLFLRTTMLRNIIIALLLIGTGPYVVPFFFPACAMHVEYLKMDSDEEQLEETFVRFLQAIDQDEELPMPGAELPGKCWACKWVVKKVKKHLGDKAKAEEIRGKLHKVCDSIGLLKDLCKKMISKSIDVLTEELSTSDDPQTICSNTGYCNLIWRIHAVFPFLMTTMLGNILVVFLLVGAGCAMHLEYMKVDSDEELFDESLDIDLAKDLPMPRAKLPGQCWVCKWAVGKLKRGLGNNPTKETVQGALKTVCNGIGFLRFICKGVVNRFMDVLTEELSTTDSVARVCSNIGLCQSTPPELIQVFLESQQKL